MKRSRLHRTVERLGERVREGPSEDAFRAEYAAVGAQVAAQRSTMRLSQAELAELCGTTQSAIARLEGGSRAARLDTLLRVANALGCELVVRLRPRTRRKEDR